MNPGSVFGAVFHFHKCSLCTPCLWLWVNLQRHFVRQAPINDNRMREPVTDAENRKPVIDLITIQRSNCALLSTRIGRLLYLVILCYSVISLWDNTFKSELWIGSWGGPDGIWWWLSHIFSIFFFFLENQSVEKSVILKMY